MASAGSGRRGNTRSEAVDPAANRPDPNKRQGAQLILGDAPKKPAWGGKGLDNDAVYQRQNTASGRDKPKKTGDAGGGISTEGGAAGAAQQSAYKEPEHGHRLPHGPASPSHKGIFPSVVIGVAALYAVWLLYVIALDQPSLWRLIFTWVFGAALCVAWVVVTNLPG